MSIMRQESLFDMQDLYKLEPWKRFEAIFSTLHIELLLFVVSKKPVYGVPAELNYPAMIYALVACIVERIPTIKDLVKRLLHDFMFHLEGGFLFSDRIPSEALLLQSLLSSASLNDGKIAITLLKGIQE